MLKKLAKHPDFYTGVNVNEDHPVRISNHRRKHHGFKVLKLYMSYDLNETLFIEFATIIMLTNLRAKNSQFELVNKFEGYDSLAFRVTRDGDEKYNYIYWVARL